MHQCLNQGKQSHYEVFDNIDDVNDLVHWMAKSEILIALLIKWSLCNLCDWVGIEP
jgi:hypothetical protein